MILYYFWITSKLYIENIAQYTREFHTNFFFLEHFHNKHKAFCMFSIHRWSNQKALAQTVLALTADVLCAVDNMWDVVSFVYVFVAAGSSIRPHGGLCAHN